MRKKPTPVHTGHDDTDATRPKSVPPQTKPNDSHEAVRRSLALRFGNRLTCTIPEAGEALGIGRVSAYECARTGQLKTIPLGGRKVVPIAALAKMLEA